MTNNLYTNIAAIKNKFDKLIKFIKEQSVECATAKVIDLFSDAVKVENHINQAYYQEDSTTFYLPNSNGIYITVFSGKGDIFGSSHVHNGTDLPAGAGMGLVRGVLRGDFRAQRYLHPLLCRR